MFNVVLEVVNVICPDPACIIVTVKPTFNPVGTVTDTGKLDVNCIIAPLSEAPSDLEVEESVIMPLEEDMCFAEVTESTVKLLVEGL